jgi:predicted ATPase with chaperone activity
MADLNLSARAFDQVLKVSRTIVRALQVETPADGLDMDS